MQVAILQDLSKNKRYWAGADWNVDNRYDMLVVPAPRADRGLSGRLLVFLDADAAQTNGLCFAEWARRWQIAKTTKTNNHSKRSTGNQ